MRKYLLASVSEREDVDLRDYEDTIIAAVHEFMPKASVTVENDCYYVDPISGDDAPVPAGEKSLGPQLGIVKAGKASPAQGVNRHNVRSLVRKYGISARENCLEVPKNVHPHLFRHSLAMSLYQNGVDLSLISQWLGHSCVETTLIYAHADTAIKR